MALLCFLSATSSLSSLASMLTVITRNKLFLNLFSLGAVQVISSLVQLIVIPHVIGKIGVDGYGAVAVAQVVMIFLAVITDYSFNQTATRSISLNRDNTATISEIFSRVFFTRAAISAMAVSHAMSSQ